MSLREVTSRADLELIDGLEAAVWGDDEDDVGYADFLEAELAVDPDGLTIVVAEAGQTVVCAAWVRFVHGHRVRDLLRRRHASGLARTRDLPRHRHVPREPGRQRGFRYLETDASDDSRPILERLGFVPVTTTTPYIWSPPAA